MATEHHGLRVKDLHSELGVSKGHASDILRGRANPGPALAIRIYRRFGLKLGPIEHASKNEIDTLERVGVRRMPQSKKADFVFDDSSDAPRKRGVV